MIDFNERLTEITNYSLKWEESLNIGFGKRSRVVKNVIKKEKKTTPKKRKRMSEINVYNKKIPLSTSTYKKVNIIIAPGEVKLVKKNYIIKRIYYQQINTKKCI